MDLNLKNFDKYYLFSAILITGVLFAGCQSSGTNGTMGLTPQEALKTFELRPGFNIELVASEPLISDPVDMTIDEDGRLYVVEMHGYPLDKSGSDRIKLLSDTNGDGQLDKATVFADSLVLPMGIMRWKKGVLVTEPPNVWYMEDTDGDGRADIKRKVLTGFDATDAESDINNPTYGLDNWIYMVNGPASNHDIYYPGYPDGPRLPRNSNNRDVRFRPDSHELEMLSGSSQFGQTFDQWGHRFLVINPAVKYS